MSEEWRPIPETDGEYEASTEGRIRSVSGTVRVFPRGVRWTTKPFRGRVLKLTTTQYGYQQVMLSVSGIKKKHWVHWLVLQTFVGPRPEGMECRHLNGQRSDNHLSNLAWGTKQENMEDQRRHGSLQQGERHAKAKLTADNVRGIRADYASGSYSLHALGAKYGIHFRTAYDVVRRKTWKTVV